MKRKTLAILLILTMVLTMENMFIPHSKMDTVQAATDKTETNNITQTKAGGDVLGTTDGFRLSDGQSTSSVYIDTAHEEISADGAKKISADGANKIGRAHV